MSVKQLYEEKNKNTFESIDISTRSGGVSSDVIIPGQNDKKGIFKKLNGKK